MTKKTNLSGKCLVLTTYWFNYFQNFGNSYTLFSKYFFISVLFNILLKKTFYLKKENFINKIKFFFWTKKLSVIISINNNSFFWFHKLNKFWYYIWKKNFSFIYLEVLVFSIKTVYLSKQFIQEYIYYLTTHNLFPPKRIFNYLVLFLTNNLAKESLVLVGKGLKIKRFIGFKIKLIGRYETSKNSMSKCVIAKVGKITSTNLKINIEFVDFCFYTKLGISNLKIWTFYSITI